MLRRRSTQGEYEIRVTNGGRNAIYIVQNHPCDVVGWDGYCYPYAFNLEEFAPITGKLHQPPPAHATFEAPGAAFCAFVPRLFDYHPLAVPVPYNHSSVDCDEVLYYVSGNFMSRRGVEEGSITLHAAGAPHGPQPGCRRVEPGEDLYRRDRGHGRHVQAAAARAKPPLRSEDPATSVPGSRRRAPLMRAARSSRAHSSASATETDAARPARSHHPRSVISSPSCKTPGSRRRRSAIGRSPFQDSSINFPGSSARSR